MGETDVNRYVVDPTVWQMVVVLWRKIKRRAWIWSPKVGGEWSSVLHRVMSRPPKQHKRTLNIRIQNTLWQYRKQFMIYCSSNIKERKIECLLWFQAFKYIHRCVSKILKMKNHCL